MVYQAPFSFSYCFLTPPNLDGSGASPRIDCGFITLSFCAQVATENAIHRPVLVDAVLSYLAPRSGGRYLDCTVGAGGHASAILSVAGPTAILVGIDADEKILVIAKERLMPFGDAASLRHGNFADLTQILSEPNNRGFDGILFDLGVSSMQLDQAERGFSFRFDAPLDMRLDQSQPLSAAHLVANLSESELRELLFSFGEESRARRIAHAIVETRAKTPIVTTLQLAAIIARIVPGGRTNPATKTFQALRIAVNRELEALKLGIKAAHGALADGGRLAVITFHSLEDRIVKQYFAGQANPCTCPPRTPICICGRTARLELVTRKSIVATSAELDANPRSRSARLRVASRIGPPL